MKALSILTAAGLIVAAQSAQPESRDMAAMGWGVSSCRQFADLYRDLPEFEENFFAWTQGYLSGQNDILIRTGQPYRDLGSLSTDRQQAILRSYCDKHPLGNFIEAVWTLEKELKIIPPVRQPPSNR